MVKAGFTVPITKMFSVQPVAEYWFPLSSDAEKTITDSTGTHSYNPYGCLVDNFVGGVNLTFSF